MSGFAWAALERLKLPKLVGVAFVVALIAFPHITDPLLIEVIRARAVPIEHELEVVLDRADRSFARHGASRPSPRHRDAGA